jgi:uncharacterized protein (UPF0332 family)
MSELLIKSKSNIDAAQLLLNNVFYASGVHSAYYSCVQRMKHYLFEKFKFNEEKLNLELEVMKAQTLKKKSGLHIYLITFFSNKLEKEPEKHKEFRDHIMQLRTLREKSDYENVSISRDDLKNAIQFSKIVSKSLDANFNR